MDTIFHKILAGEIPNYTVYEDEHVLSFLNIHPNSKGHTIVIPKVFGITLLDLPDDALSGYMIGIKHTMKRLEDVLSPGGFNVGWNVKEIGGQSIDYVHCHVMPRYKGDGGGNMHTIVDAPDGDVEDVAALLETYSAQPFRQTS